ncbi:MAG: TonB-dependent receptor [Dokdonella sp.]|uniref:TonB-dependent receptor n=1 Tax=Dokdonella sp. TaxID=2291710 RepID=UPI003F7DD62C
MRKSAGIRRVRATLAAFAFGASICASAQTSQQLEPVEVTTSKIPIALSDVAADVSIVGGDELRALGANDLRTALSLVAGIDIAPGGDGGPASSVPALWGLREFDAFLLVVDGIPSGGAFTPALATLNLANVERIEIVKGAAPVSYGATSFVGVIHVIHYAAGAGPAQVEVGFGSRGSAHVAAAIPLSGLGDGWSQSLLVDADKNELATDRAGWDRAHLLYRGAGDVGAGRFSVDADFTQLKQDPTSPHPREHGVLTERVPLDANTNPRGAEQDEDRGQLAFGYVLPTALGDWSTRLAYARSNADNVRGFLREDFADDGVTHNADGFRQRVHRTEVYLDSHVATALNERATLVWGLDHLYGKGDQRSDNFEYATLPDGSNAPDWRTLHIDEATRLDDRRNFTGLYADLEYAVTDAWRVEAGLRFNHTRESASGIGVDLTGDEPEVAESGSDRRNDDRWAGALGTSYRFWQDGTDHLTAYASYRDTFKPAVKDFGPEPEFDILEPEDAQSGEIGLKGRHADGRFEWDVSLFRMNFHNLVVSQDVDGLPGLANAGNEHFKGAEAEARWRFDDALSLIGSWAWHDARFADYVQDFDGTPTQLDGKRLEMSPTHLASVGVVYAPAQGLRAHVVAPNLGEPGLNKGHTPRAG